MMTSKRFVYTCFVFLIIFATFESSVEARKLLNVRYDIDKKDVISLDHDKLYFSQLPKGRVRGSSPSKRGHATTVGEKLVARHLAAVGRILRSVPSPGMGH